MNGLGTLVHLAARRSRWFWALWILGLAAVVPATAAAYEQVFPDPARAGLIIEGLAGNPTMRAMLGPPFSLDEPGGFTVWRVGTFVATVAGVMSILGVVRTTRADEEEGRTELTRSAVVGRHAPLAASVVVSLAACAALGLLITLGMTAVGTAAAGSALFGLGTALTAAVFAGVGAVTAQLTASARTARGTALAVLGTAYLLRAVADGAADGSVLRRLQWVSPVEWMALSRPYAGERWWVLVLPAALTAALFGTAVALEARRDHGSGLWPARLGPAGAGPGLAGPMGLAWRLQRGSVLGWTVAMLVLGAVMGSIATGFAALVADTPRLELILRRMGGGSEILTEAFMVSMMAVLVLLAAALGVQLLGRLRAEEEQGHAEAVLATAVSRVRFALSHLLLALAVPAVLFVATGALLALSTALAEDDWALVAEVTVGAAVLVPGVWLTVALSMLALGWAPRLAPAVWLLIGWSLLVTWVGAVLGLPQWLAELTPFARLPALPVEPLSWPPVLLTAAVAAAVLVLGLVGYRRRDLTGS